MEYRKVEKQLAYITGAAGTALRMCEKTTRTALSMCEKQVKLARDDSRGLDPGKSTNQPKTCTFYMHDMTYHISMHMYDVILPAHMWLYCMLAHYAGMLLTGACFA